MTAAINAPKTAKRPKRFSKNTVLACAAVFAFMTAFVAAPAFANPEVKLEWISKGGASISPPQDSVVVTQADIDADTELVLRISLVLDSVQIHEFGFLVLFDEDLKDELDIPAGETPTEPSSYGPFDSIGFFQVFDSDDLGAGLIGPYRGCVANSICLEPQSFVGTPVGNQTIVIDEVTFVTTDLATNDRRDITINNAPFQEEFRDASGELIDHSEITFGHASVVPEPAQGLMTAAAVLTIAGLSRRRTQHLAQHPAQRASGLAA